MSLCTLFTPGCQTLGMNVTIFPLIFIQKSRPCVLLTNQKQQAYLATERERHLTTGKRA